MAPTTAAEHAVHPVDAHVGARLRRRRQSLRISQTSLATSLGITFQQIQKYERAANRMSASALHGAACILRVPIGYFFEGLEAPEAATPPVADPESQELAVHFLRLDSKMRRRVLALIQAIADQETDSAVL